MTQLIFVYNADSGGLNTLFDIAHKVVSPETYSCSLCMLTHGVLSERTAWKLTAETLNELSTVEQLIETIQQKTSAVHNASPDITLTGL
jgi:hypothetical protein